jgi:hypothetical protein
MTFSSFCIWACILQLLLFLWSFTLVYLGNSSVKTLCVTSFTPSMPVVTRSKAKLHTATGSIDELSPVLLGTIGSTDGLLDSSCTLQKPSFISPSFDESLAISLPSTSLMSTALEFQTSTTTNLEISNRHLFEISNSSVLTDTLPHNFPVLIHSIMEGDCDEKIPLGMSQPKQDMGDLHQLFASFTHQMMTHMEQLHARLADNDTNLRSDHDHFKQEVRSELMALRSLLQSSSSSSASSLPHNLNGMTSTQGTVSVSSHVPSVPASSNTLPTSLSGPDIQVQMMLMLTESFNKLTTVMGDQMSQEAKSEWPEFVGDVKNFRPWYLSIMAQLSTHPWCEFYDASTNSPVSTTQNTQLNGRLYAKLISVLEGQALQDMISRPHLRANGILLLHELG